MPKIKIGEKVVIGETQNKELKRFTNGHKAFTAAESRALLELQARERSAAERFDQTKYQIIRDRDPITGGVTPRTKVDRKGEVIQTTGIPLFTYQPPPPRTAEQEEAEAERRILENQNPLKRSDKVEERISSLQNRQDVIGGELSYLQQQIEERKKLLLPNNKSLTRTGSLKIPKF